jgi:hypothetical protein
MKSMFTSLFPILDEHVTILDGSLFVLFALMI